MDVSRRTVGICSPACIRSRTRMKRLPSLPPGWRNAKSSSLKPFRSRSAIASASPRARVAVVDAVGARPRGHASLGIAAERWKSAPRASVELGLPVMATIDAPMRSRRGIRLTSSSVSPELEMARTTSPRTTMPRSPWLASAGWRKNDGVPVDASVALIFLQMIPDLPRPIVTTRPGQALMRSTTSTKVWSRWWMMLKIAADSTSSTRFASARAGWISTEAMAASLAHRALLRQQRPVNEVADGNVDAALRRHAHDRAELRVELGRLAVHDVALQRGRGVGREHVVALHRALEGVVGQRGTTRGGEGDDLAHGALGELARLGHGAPDAERGARDRADAAHRRDEEELRPHRAVDVGRDLGIDAGAQEGVAEPLQPLAAAVVELTEHDEGIGADVANVPRLDRERDDRAKAADNVLAAGDRGDLLRRFHAVLHRHDRGVVAEEGKDAPGRLGHLPRFDAHEDSVDFAVAHDFRPLDDEVALDALDAQGVEGPPDNERDVLPPRRELPAEVAADAARPNHRDSHTRQLSLGAPASRRLARRRPAAGRAGRPRPSRRDDGAPVRWTSARHGT